MGRPKKARKSNYKRYYVKGSAEEEIPESTMRSKKKARLEVVPQGLSSDNDSNPGSLDDVEPESGATSNESLLEDSSNASGQQSAPSDKSDNEERSPIPHQISSQDVESDESSGSNRVNLGYEAHQRRTTPGEPENPSGDSNSSSEVVDHNAANEMQESECCSSEGEGVIDVRLSHQPNFQHSPTDNPSDNSHDTSCASENSTSSPGVLYSNAASDRQESEDNEQNCDSEVEDDSENEDGASDPFKRLKRSFDTELNLTVNISVGQVLANALALSRKHNWSHSEMEGIMKFATSILNNGSILPNSRYLLDDFFYSKKDMSYCFFCSKCTLSLGQVPADKPRISQILCPGCKTVNILSDLSKANYFVLFNLPAQIQLLLSDDTIRRKLVNPVEFKNRPIDNIMRDLYNGSMYKNFARYVESNFSPDVTVFSFTLSVDSASLCSFSGQKICPCFIMLNELPPVLRMGNLLIAGIWFGTGKEKIDLFLPPIVKHITELSTKGFSLELPDCKIDCKAFLIACCADSVARCDVQGIHGHRGDFPCSWCLIEGEEENGVRIFRPQHPAPEARTLKELQDDARTALETRCFFNGVKYLSPLAAAPFFHSVNGFIVDQMHAKDEGTSKAFLKAWLGMDSAATNPSFLSSEAKLELLKLRMNSLRPPREFRKSIRSIQDVAHWTGRELENWAMFISVPSLVDIVAQRYLSHWALYVQAMHILLSSNLPIEALSLAETLLHDFCNKTENLYGSCMLRFNMHLLHHFAQNAERWGPCFALSAYAFEAGNQRLKKLVQDVNYIPNQICRGISEMNALSLLQKHYNTDNFQLFCKSIEPKQHAMKTKVVGRIKVLGIGKLYKPTEEELWLLEQRNLRNEHFEEHSLIEKDGCMFGPDVKKNTKSDNSFCRLSNGHVINIQRILYCDRSNEILVLGRRVRCQPSAYCPQSVVQLDWNLCFLYTVTSIDEDLQFYQIDDLTSVCLNLQLAHGHFVSPLPNIYNMF